MARVLMIGAGGVATVAAYKIAQNPDVFTEFMIASRRKAKCDALVEAIHKKGYTLPIQTAQVDALQLIAAVEHAGGDGTQVVGQLHTLQFLHRRELRLTGHCHVVVA